MSPAIRCILPSPALHVLFFCSLAFYGPAHAQSTPSDLTPDRLVAASVGDRELRHGTPEWLAMEPHLPNSKTATPGQLELAGDVLHARRFLEDALEYYRFALERGGDEVRLSNRIGVLELEMHQPGLARAHFRHVTTMHPKDPTAWNNLGAAEYILANYSSALADYRRAVKLEKRNAIFHVNLGTAYFELRDFESAGKQFSMAQRLDPAVFTHQDGGGVQAHVLSASDRGRFCFELARVSAAARDDAAVLSWLTKSSETGYDIGEKMAGVKAFEPYVRDPRVLLIEANARALRSGNRIASTGPVQPLPPETANQ